MLTLIIWWAAILLESLVLFRGFRANILEKYPFFYAYIASLLLSDGPLYLLYIVSPASYPKWNWAAGFLNLILGCGIILEIFKHVLSSYAGAERFARVTGLIVFGVIFSLAILHPVMMPETFRIHATNIEVERNFLAAQAIFLFSILGVISYYRVAIGKNLKGMIFGYGLCLGATLMTLALRSYIGSRFNAAWIFIQPFSYLASLFIWVVALWSYHPSPAPESTIRLEADYEAFVARTRSAMDAMRSHLVRAGRP